MGVKRDHETSTMSDNVGITEDEAALYDRQIRLWGVECQRKIRAADILIIGLNGLGVEIAKNLALSGVESITLLDSKPVCEADQSAQFFAAAASINKDSNVPSRAEASRSSIQDLNPNVKVIVEQGSASSKNVSFFCKFRAVFATDCELSFLIQLDSHLRGIGVLFFCGATWGFYGFGFLDLMNHRFLLQNTKKEGVTKSESISYCSLGDAIGTKVGLGLSKRINKVYFLLHVLNHFQILRQGELPSPSRRAEDKLLLKEARTSAAKILGCDEARCSDDMLNQVFGELSPVCAAVGGVMANEIIKGVSGSKVPIHNFLLFDGDECNAVVESIMVPR